MIQTHTGRRPDLDAIVAEAIAILASHELQHEPPGQVRNRDGWLIAKTGLSLSGSHVRTRTAQAAAPVMLEISLRRAEHPAQRRGQPDRRRARPSP